ncbi:MAG: choice-of-anchor tandem repeat GloVer-containing protein [Bryobacteraceae bacterium]
MATLSPARFYFALLSSFLIAASPAHAGSYAVLHVFGQAPNGSFPYSGLIQDPAGNFYGTASGSQSGPGVVFKLDMAGNYSVLQRFKEGDLPTGALVRDPSGALYGTTFLGGASNHGVVFKLDSAGKYTVLHSFNDENGSEPYANLLRDAAGNLYGTTVLGGKWGYGVVFKLDASGAASVLHSFNGETEGAEPYGGLIEDPAGNLYGTTAYGGSSVCSCGVVFQIDPAGKETVLYTFNGYDGAYPEASLMQDTEGNLYGTTLNGGADGLGTVFKLDLDGQAAILHSFTGGSGTQPDGAFPHAGLIMDSAGNVYGTTLGGASYGTVFEIDAAGNETILYSFTASYYQNDPSSLNGYSPMGTLVRDAAGNLYGTTTDGGVDEFGTVFELSAGAKESLLFSFPAFPDGAQPAAGLVRDSAGNLYGTTVGGGAYACDGDLGPAAPGCGTVFELSASGQETLLYSFPTAFNPRGDLIRDTAGNLYGTGSTGGASNAGAVFELDALGNQTVLYSFTGGADGGKPLGGLVRDSAGNFYGTASAGGASHAGVVFKLDASGNQSVLHNFTGGADGGAPLAGLISDSAGNFYGTTSAGGASQAGVVFKLTAVGQETVLHSFTGADGSTPSARLLRDSTSNLYGTTQSGGASNAGVVFKLDAAGNQTVLYSFTGGGDGKAPEAGLVQDLAGNLYGTASLGGTITHSNPAGSGVVFKVDPSGHETVLHSFAGSADGGNPVSDLIMDPAGNLYGAAQLGGGSVPVLTGGVYPSGVVFMVIP